MLPRMRDVFSLTDEQRQVRDLVRALARERVAPLAAQVDQTETYPTDQLTSLGEQGLMGLYIPEAYGGAGLGALAFCLAVEEIAWACASTAVIYLVQYTGGFPIVTAGSEAQKRRYLPRLAAGEITAAFSLSEPGAGSDAGALTTTAVRRGDRYLLNGTKMWVTNGSHAGVITLFATVDRGKGHRGVTAFLVEPTFPGFALGKLERKLGIRGSPTVALHLSDCEVPVENRLGDEGEGFRIALRVLDGSRPAVAPRPWGSPRPRSTPPSPTPKSGSSSASRSRPSRGFSSCSRTWRCRRTGRASWSTTPQRSWTAAPPGRRSSRRWPSASRATRRCGSRRTPCRSSTATATRASIPSSASCATPRSRRSTRARTRSSGS